MSKEYLQKSIWTNKNPILYFTLNTSKKQSTFQIVIIKKDNFGLSEVGFGFVDVEKRTISTIFKKDLLLIEKDDWDSKWIWCESPESIEWVLY